MTDLDDKIKAAAKAVANKVDDSYRDLKEEYRKEKYEGNVKSESEIGKDIERAADKVEAGVKAVANKVDDAYRNMKRDYRKEKIKQKLD
jgi:ribosomal protein S21